MSIESIDGRNDTVPIDVSVFRKPNFGQEGPAAVPSWYSDPGVEIEVDPLTSTADTVSELDGGQAELVAAEVRRQLAIIDEDKRQRERRVKIGRRVAAFTVGLLAAGSLSTAGWWVSYEERCGVNLPVWATIMKDAINSVSPAVNEERCAEQWPWQGRTVSDNSANGQPGGTMPEGSTTQP